MSKDATTAGICYLVGAGPGDLGLVTLKAKECIEEADVVVYDYLCNAEMLTWAQDDAEMIYAGKKSKHHTMIQGDINDLLVEKALEGKTVTRLKGGDPMVFGRGGEEAARLVDAGVPFEIVPGISSTIAGPAYAGIPVTHREHNSQLTIFTGHEDPTKEDSSVDYAKIAKTDGVKVMLMGVERIRLICDAMINGGGDPNTEVALIRWATTGRQETLTGTLNTIATKVEESGFKAPAVCVIGGVVSLHDKLNWFESRPLFGKRIVVTRTRKHAGALSKQLRRLGADVYELPTIRIEEPEDKMEFGELVQDAHKYDWLIFTSPNGVEAFFKMFYKLYSDAREIGGVKICAIGPGTEQKIREYHLTVDLMPKKFVAEGVVDAFQELGSSENLHILWVRGEQARDVISKKFSEMGVILDQAIAYRTVPETNDVAGGIARFKEEGADLITFTSSSTAECFHQLNLPMPEEIQVASIGPITTETVKKCGMSVDIEAENHDIPGLVTAITELCNRDSN